VKENKASCVSMWLSTPQLCGWGDSLWMLWGFSAAHMHVFCEFLYSNRQNQASSRTMSCPSYRGFGHQMFETLGHSFLHVRMLEFLGNSVVVQVNPFPVCPLTWQIEHARLLQQSM
jgi:hypothetical protein